jgi:hypothetical protein
MDSADLSGEPLTRMTITMLGVSQSGKSTYILGAYAGLVRGADGCSLHTPDPDAGMGMIRELDALRSGALPQPTTDKPVLHEFILTSGSTVLTAIDLTDYRGGAITDVTRGKEADTAQLHRRLLNSDSIFVVLDSTHFREPITPVRLQAVAEATAADRVADLLGKALAERQQTGRWLPSIAVLLTKADLIDERRGSASRGFAELHSEIRSLLPTVFRPGVVTQVFPVSVGEFGGPANGHAPSLGVDLRNVGAPIIFAVACFLNACQLQIQRQREQVVVSRQPVARVLNELTSRARIIQWFTRARITAAHTALAGMDAHLAMLDARWNEMHQHTRTLWEKVS